MQTLTHNAQIDEIGPTKIETDVNPREFFEGRGSLVTFEPETGGQSILAVPVTREEGMALAELAKLLANPAFPAASEVKEYLEERVGEVDWDRIASRYEHVPNGGR